MGHTPKTGKAGKNPNMSKQRGDNSPSPPASPTITSLKARKGSNMGGTPRRGVLNEEGNSSTSILEKLTESNQRILEKVDRMDEMIEKVDRMDEMMLENLEMRKRVTEIEGRVAENSDRQQENAANIEILFKRMNSQQAVNLMIRKEQFSMKKHMLNMSMSIPKVKEETLRDMKDSERETRILVITDFAFSELRGYKGADEYKTLLNFTYAQLRYLHPQLRRSDIVFVKSIPSTRGKFRLLAEMQTKQQAELIKQRGMEAGYKIRLGESHLLRKIMRNAHKTCDTLNNKGDGNTYEVRNGTQIFKIDVDGHEEQLFTKSSAELATPGNLNLESPMYAFVGDSDESDIEDELEEERRKLEDENYNPTNNDTLKAERCKRRREEVEEVRAHLEETDVSSQREEKSLGSSKGDPSPSPTSTMTISSSEDEFASPPKKKLKRGEKPKAKNERKEKKDKGVGKRSGKNHNKDDPPKHSHSNKEESPKREAKGGNKKVSFRNQDLANDGEVSEIDDEMDYTDSDVIESSIANDTRKGGSKRENQDEGNNKNFDRDSGKESDLSSPSESRSPVSTRGDRRKSSSYREGDSHRPPTHRRNRFSNGYKNDYRSRNDRRRHWRNSPSWRQPRFHSDSDEYHERSDYDDRYARDEVRQSRHYKSKERYSKDTSYAGNRYRDQPRSKQGGRSSRNRSERTTYPYDSRDRKERDADRNPDKQRTEREDSSNPTPKRGGSRAGRLSRGAPRGSRGGKRNKEKEKETEKENDTTRTRGGKTPRRTNRGRGNPKNKHQPLDKMSTSDIENYLKMKKERELIDQRMKALQTEASTSKPPADDSRGKSSTDKGST